MSYMPARRHELEQQRHAAILQQATRRKLSSRYPISPHRLNTVLKRTKVQLILKIMNKYATKPNGIRFIELNIKKIETIFI